MQIWSQVVKVCYESEFQSHCNNVYLWNYENMTKKKKKENQPQHRQDTEESLDLSVTITATVMRNVGYFKLLRKETWQILWEHIIHAQTIHSAE